MFAHLRAFWRSPRVRRVALMDGAWLLIALLAGLIGLDMGGWAGIVVVVIGALIGVLGLVDAWTVWRSDSTAYLAEDDDQ